jgi:hypothetical protein
MSRVLDLLSRPVDALAPQTRSQVVATLRRIVASDDHYADQRGQALDGLAKYDPQPAQESAAFIAERERLSARLAADREYHKFEAWTATLSFFNYRGDFTLR